jgi:hypothetical protein
LVGLITPIVVVVGCAAATPQPHIWTLSHASAREESSRPGIANEEKDSATKRPLGRDTYQLIGVADFVDRETSRTIGVRGELLAAPRVNATGLLADGHKVAVKGLYIAATPPRINLTSVVDLGARCPD